MGRPSQGRRAVIGYEGIYEVDEDGAVWSLPRPVYYKSGEVRYHTKGRRMSEEFVSGGYRRVILSKNGRSVKTLVHRVVAEAFLENPEAKPYVNHKDGIKWNNFVENLEWCTSSENARHAHDTGLIDMEYHKIPEDIRAAVRRYYIRGSSTRGCVQTGIKFGIGKQTVLNIVKEAADGKNAG